MWDLPRPGLEPVSPALAGRFSTTAPPGKPQLPFFELLLTVRCLTLTSLHINGNIQDKIFCAWLPLLNMMFMKLIYVMAYRAAVYLFPLMDGILSYEYTTMYLYILPLLVLWRYDWCCNDKHSCNAFCYTFAWVSVGYKHGSVIPGSKFVHGESWHYKTVFQTHINWCSYQHQLRVLTVPTPCWYLVLPFCLI